MKWPLRCFLLSPAAAEGPVSLFNGRDLAGGESRLGVPPVTAEPLGVFQVVTYELHSPEWQELVRGGKARSWPGYSRAKRGHTGLQDHGDPVWFRNIRIRPLTTD